MVPVEPGPHRVVQGPLTNYSPQARKPEPGDSIFLLGTSVKVTKKSPCSQLQLLVQSRAPSQMDPFSGEPARSETEKLNHLQSGTSSERDWSEFQTDSNVSFGQGT